MILSNANVENLKKGIAEFNGRYYDLVKIGNEMDKLMAEILSEYEINVDDNTEKSE